MLRRTPLVHVCEILRRNLSAETFWLGHSVPKFRWPSSDLHECHPVPNSKFFNSVTISAFGTIDSLINFTEVIIWQFQYLKISSILETLKVFQSTYVEWSAVFVQSRLSGLTNIQYKLTLRPNECRVSTSWSAGILMTIMTGYCSSQIVDLCHNSKGFISCFYVTILPCILVRTLQHVLRFICFNFQTSLLTTPLKFCGLYGSG
jgi:hypothetical protein